MIYSSFYVLNFILPAEDKIFYDVSPTTSTGDGSNVTTDLALMSL